MEDRPTRPELPLGFRPYDETTGRECAVLCALGSPINRAEVDWINARVSALEKIQRIATDTVLTRPQRMDTILALLDAMEG